MDNPLSGPGVKGLCSRFEERPDQHGQKPVKKPKPVLRKDVTTKAEPAGNSQPNVPPKSVKPVVGNQQKLKKDAALPPKLTKSKEEAKTHLIVMYEGKELPQQFTAQDGQIYKLRQMPSVDGPPPEKPEKPTQGEVFSHRASA